jgi:hypothetical protein
MHPTRLLAATAVAASTAFMIVIEPDAQPLVVPVERHSFRMTLLAPAPVCDMIDTSCLYATPAIVVVPAQRTVDLRQAVKPLVVPNAAV